MARGLIGLAVCTSLLGILCSLSLFAVYASDTGAEKLSAANSRPVELYSTNLEGAGGGMRRSLADDDKDERDPVDMTREAEEYMREEMGEDASFIVNNNKKSTKSRGSMRGTRNNKTKGKDHAPLELMETHELSAHSAHKNKKAKNMKSKVSVKEDHQPLEMMDLSSHSASTGGDSGSQGHSDSLSSRSDSASSKKSSKDKEQNKKKSKSKNKELLGEEPVVHNHHPLVSPRNGTDISTAQKQLAVLRCPNQSKCIVPELQLQETSKVYLCKHPARHGVRFYFIVKEGLLLHPNVLMIDDIDVALKDPADGGADYVVYLPGSSPWHKTECTNSSLKSKMIVMDEFDGHSLFYPYKTQEEVAQVYGKDKMWYYMYFKRSFVARRDGQFMGHPHLSQKDVYPMTYAIAEAYVQNRFQMKREIELLCTLRGNARMSTRLRVQTWVQEYATTRDISSAVTGQVDKASRTTVSKGYFSQMYNSQIIVTVNPANWEGDFRLWESFATGALIFVDPIFVPHPMPLLDGIHCVFYHNTNRTELFEKLDYYRKNTEEARRIAINGYLHAMKHHRTVNMIDYVLRSAHLKTRLMQKHQQQLDRKDRDTRASKGHYHAEDHKTHDHEEDELEREIHIPEYTYTAQYLNHQIKDQKHLIKKNNRPAELMAVVGLHHDEHQPHSLDHMYENE